MRIAFFLVRHPPERKSPLMAEVMRVLAGRGASVEAIYPDEGVVDLGDLEIEHDLYVLKSKTETALGVAGALHALGAAILNPYPVAVACRDKVVAARVLQAAGVPQPATYVAADGAALEPLLRDGPLVLKPQRGSQGRGVRLVRTASELAGISPVPGPVVAQRYHEPRGLDRKLYSIGGRIYGVKRPWPARTFEEKLGTSFKVAPELGEVALRCGAAFGIDTFGVDVVESDDGPRVVDFSSFPGFKGVPNAAGALADVIEDAARRALAGEPPVHAPAFRVPAA